MNPIGTGGVSGRVGSGTNANTNITSPQIIAVKPEQINVAILAQFFKRSNPTPQNIPKIVTASAIKSSALTNAWKCSGKFGVAMVRGIMEEAIAASVTPSMHNTLPAIATAPDTVIDVDGLFAVGMVRRYISPFPARRNLRLLTIAKLSLDVRFLFA